MYGSITGNLAGTAYFLYFQFIGLTLIFLLFRREKPLPKLLLGSVTGSLLLTWLPILFSFFCGFTLTAHILALFITLPVPAIALRLYRLQRPFPESVRRFCTSLLQHIVFGGVLILFLLFWAYLLHTHTILPDSDGALYTGQCTYGDMNMHLGFITSLARQGTFPPDYSIMPGIKLSYPFLSDSISASLCVLGASLRFAYILPMLFALGQIFTTVYLFADTLLGSRRKSFWRGGNMLTLLLFFCNGGLGFAYFLDWSKERTYSFSDIFTGFYTTPTNLVEQNIRWVNVIADMFLPQRATLFGYAVLFPGLWLLYRAAFLNRREYFPLAGMFMAALPMIHTHSFLSAGVISAVWLLLWLFRKVYPDPAEARSTSRRTEPGYTSTRTRHRKSEAGETSRKTAHAAKTAPTAPSPDTEGGTMPAGISAISHSADADAEEYADLLEEYLYHKAADSALLKHPASSPAAYLRSHPGTWILAVFILVMCLTQAGVTRNILAPNHLMLMGISLFAVTAIGGIYLLVLLIRQQGWKELLHGWGIYLACILVLALPQLLFWTFGQVAAGGFVRGHFNWGNQGDLYPWFYLKNIGMPLLLILGGICACGRKRAPLFLPALFLWWLGELIVFTPNTYDNNKLLYAAYFLLCLGAADYAMSLYGRIKYFPGNRIFVTLFLFCAAFSGILTLGRETVSRYQLYSPEQVALAEYIEKNTPADAVFLTDTRHNNEIASLTGRNIVCGADTFLYFHGLDTTERKKDLQLMYEAPSEHMDLFEKYNVSYVVISAFERNSYSIDESAFRANFKEVLSIGGITLYHVY